MYKLKFTWTLFAFCFEGLLDRLTDPRLRFCGEFWAVNEWINWFLLSSCISNVCLIDFSFSYASRCMWASRCNKFTCWPNSWIRFCKSSINFPPSLLSIKIFALILFSCNIIIHFNNIWKENLLTHIL